MAEDLDAYYPLLKGPRILCGDDYGWRDRHNPSSGPGPAVDAFAKKHKWPVHVVGGWFWYMIGEEEGRLDRYYDADL